MTAQRVTIDLTLSDDSEVEILSLPPRKSATKRHVRRVSTDCNGSPAMMRHTPASFSASTSKAPTLTDNLKDEDPDIEILDAPSISDSKTNNVARTNLRSSPLEGNLQKFTGKLPEVLIKKSKRAGKSISQQFIHPRMWVRLLDKEHPGVQFDIDDYEKLWVYAVENVDLMKLDWVEVRADMGLVAGVKRLEVDKFGSSQGSLGAGLDEIGRRVADEDKIKAAVKEEVEDVKELIFKCELTTKVEHGKLGLINVQKRLSKAFEHADFHKVDKLEKRARKKARALGALEPASIQEIQAPTGSNMIPLGAPNQFFRPPPMNGELPEGNDNRLNQDIASTEAKFMAEGEGPKWKFNPIQSLNDVSQASRPAAVFKPYTRIPNFTPDVPMALDPVHSDTDFFRRPPLPTNNSPTPPTWGMDRYPFSFVSGSSYTAQHHVPCPPPNLIGSKDWYAGSSDFPLEIDVEDISENGFESSSLPPVSSVSGPSSRTVKMIDRAPPSGGCAPFARSPIGAHVKPEIKNEPLGPHMSLDTPAPVEFDVDLSLHFGGIPRGPRKAEESKEVKRDDEHNYECYVEAIHGDMELYEG